MEWNEKTPSQWDWENLLMFSGKENEIPNRIHATDWGIEGDGGISNMSSYFSGGAGSDLGNGSSSNSSILASVNSSSKERTEVSNFDFETVEDFAKELGRVEDPGTPTMGASVSLDEPLIGLKLGKRTYFEDVCAETTNKPSSFPASPNTTTKRSRAAHQRTRTLLCQVEGCNLDLTSAKDYNRRHRVCEIHSKCPKVIIAGLECRFCQQCSRFHNLVEFDAKKRSCRRRLSNHNARRRKPQAEAVQFNSTRPSSSFYDGRKHMSPVLNRLPLLHTWTAANPPWESTCGFKPAQEKGFMMRPAKAGGIGTQLHFPVIDPPNAISMINHDCDRLLPFKGATAEVLNQGLEAPLIASNLDAPRFQHALCLLSNNGLCSSDPNPTSGNWLMHANHKSVVHPVTHVVSQGYALSSSEY